MVIIGFVAFIQIARGNANMGVDFSGGSLLQYKATEDFTMAEVRNAFSKNEMEDIDLQEVENEHRLMIKVKKSEAVVANLGDKVGSILSTELPEKQFTLESQSEIGSSVSSVLRNKAIQAILISLAGVIVYLAFRFDIRFGLAAATATFHDVMVVLGICWLMDIEITLLLVTALLTLAGYSLNDSVVVFDRIRENMHKSVEHSLTPVINDSINQTLSRTIVTGNNRHRAACPVSSGWCGYPRLCLCPVDRHCVGTYSSIFIASPLLTLWEKKTA